MIPNNDHRDAALVFPCRGCGKLQPVCDARSFWDPCDGAEILYCSECLPPKMGKPLERPYTVCGVCGDAVHAADIQTAERLDEPRVSYVDPRISLDRLQRASGLSPRVRVVCKRCAERRPR